MSYCSIAVKRSHDCSNSYKEKHLIGLAYSFRGLAHFHRGKEHGGRQVNNGAERLRVPYLYIQAAERERAIGPCLDF